MDMNILLVLFLALACPLASTTSLKVRRSYFETTSAFSNIPCIQQTNLTGIISDSLRNYFHYGTEKCYHIKVPSKFYIVMNVTEFNSDITDCSRAFLKINGTYPGQVHKFCQRDFERNPVTFLSDVSVMFYIRENSGYIRNFRFTLEYTIRSLKCTEQDSFSCDSNICIDRNQVCDGVRDCNNGEDEKGCNKGVLAVEGIAEARSLAAVWLQSKRTESWGWQENTHRAVVALFLANAVTFNGTNNVEELISKQAELKTSLALLKPSLTNNELSMFIHSLLVTCHNPRHFYGNDLVKWLQQQTVSSTNLTHPIAYLALCNANQTWPQKAMDDLSYVLQSNSAHLFIRDIQAMAVMAVSCMENSKLNQNLRSFQNITLPYLVNDTIIQFKSSQQEDGSFGSVYTTALIVQALIASGHENSKDWKLKESVQYLMKQLNSSSINFLSAYLTLPILNGKTMVDISNINCSNILHRKNEDPVSELDEYTGPRIRIQYSLFVDDLLDVVYTIFLRVPENSTAFQVMKLAAAHDTKYKFQWKDVSQQKYVYEIAGITNDPEVGKFWLLYLDYNKTGVPGHLIESPDKVVMQNKDHLIMWFKTADI